MTKKVLIVIRDWWWYRADLTDNAIAEVNTPNTDMMMDKYPNILINASGEYVWLPDGYQWNSEVWHMTIWSWRVIFQSLERINRSIKDWSFFENDAIKWAIQNCKDNSSKLHLMWLLQWEWVHAHIDHLFGILDFCAKENFHNVVIHVFTDWRDAPVTKSLEYIDRLNNKINELWFGKIATVMWRFYAMDRDKRRDRTQIAYNAIVNTQWVYSTDNIVKSIKDCHNTWETDEFIRPIVLNWYEWVKSHDSMIFWNFRTDRTRQLTKAIVEKEFDWRDRKPLDVYYAWMTQFYSPMNAHVIFPEVNVKNCLWEVLSKAWLRQLRISETEKYAHVTFFFNWQVETPFENEDRILIPSPKVATYDLAPEMSAYEITDKICEKMDNDNYDVIITNLVNWDMVWHTWVIDAIHTAVKTVDDCIWKLIECWLKNWYELLVFADHGNVEDQTPEWRTSHTTNPVPFIVVSNEQYELRETWSLADIAPTVLKILWIKKPIEMTGESLIK